MEPRIGLLVALVAIAAGYVAFWVRARLAHLGIGFVTNFFDTLGIGSFATTTTMYRMWRLVVDEKIPGTLNVGHALPAVVQALIYITIVQVDFRTLVLLIGSAVAGSWIGAAIVAGMPRRAIQRGMGTALLVAAGLMLITALQESSPRLPDGQPSLQILPLGGTDLALTGGRLILGCTINFVLGALMTLGIGLYAPCMIMVSLLGMNPTAAFPIMMGSCAFLMPMASMQFIRRQKYDLRAAVGLAVGGIPAVVVAAMIVRALPLQYVRWLVVAVVIYAAVSLLRSSIAEAARTQREAATA